MHFFYTRVKEQPTSFDLLVIGIRLQEVEKNPQGLPMYEQDSPVISASKVGFKTGLNMHGSFVRMQCY